MGGRLHNANVYLSITLFARGPEKRCARVTCRLEVNRKRCADGAELSYVVKWSFKGLHRMFGDCTLLLHVMQSLLNDEYAK